MLTNNVACAKGHNFIQPDYKSGAGQFQYLRKVSQLSARNINYAGINLDISDYTAWVKHSKVRSALLPTGYFLIREICRQIIIAKSF